MSDSIHTPEEKAEALGGCGLLMILIVLAPFATWWHAWVTLTMYNWFILPFVAGAPAMSIVPFIGLSSIMGMYTYHLANLDNTKKDGTKIKASDMFTKALTRMFFYPLVALGFAWVYQFIFIR